IERYASRPEHAARRRQDAPSSDWQTVALELDRWIGAKCARQYDERFALDRLRGEGGEQLAKVIGGERSSVLLLKRPDVDDDPCRRQGYTLRPRLKAGHQLLGRWASPSEVALFDPGMRPRNCCHRSVTTTNRASKMILLDILETPTSRSAKTIGRSTMRAPRRAARYV